MAVTNQTDMLVLAVAAMAYALFPCLMAYALRVGVDVGSDVGVAVGLSDGTKVGCSVATVGLVDGGLVGRS